MNKETYKVVNGTSYKTITDEKIINVLETARINRTRLRLYFGDPVTGKDWHQEYDITGYIGRSTGDIKIPLLIHNSTSHGGGAILDHCIIKITESKGKRILFQNSNYQAPTFSIVSGDMPEYSHNLLIDGELYARCTSEQKAVNLQTKLS